MALDTDIDLLEHVPALSLLGPEAHAFLAPYLRYTRATHRDLLHLLPDPGRPPPASPP